MVNFGLQDSSDLEVNFDQQSDVLKNEKGRTLHSSNRDKSEKVGRTLRSANHDKSEKVDICARNIWNNWAQDKNLTDHNCSYPVFDDLCTQIKDKDHFVELLQKFIYEVRDTFLYHCHREQCYESSMLFLLFS
jgi:hypothetical protein